MYTRYVPRPDGSYQRNHISDPPMPPPEIPQPEQSCQPPPKPKPAGSIGSFFRQILPKGLDTADLIVVLLLLLMAADREEEQNTALLTLALYLFM